MPNPLIDQLKTMKPEQLQGLYQEVFKTLNAQLVLEDLKARFWHYFPTPGIREDGQEDVIKHINNMINPVEIYPLQQEERPHD